jgi:hypothetical protein
MVAAAMATGMQAGTQMQQGRFQESMYNSQATQTRLQGRAQAVRYEQQANAVMKRSLSTQAMARARAFAGGIDPFSGSAQFVQTVSSRDAAQDVSMLKDNADMAVLNAGFQSNLYEQAGRQARSNGLLSAVTTMGLGGLRGYSLYGSTGEAFPGMQAGLRGLRGPQEMVPGQYDLDNRQYG